MYESRSPRSAIKDDLYSLYALSRLILWKHNRVSVLDFMTMKLWLGAGCRELKAKFRTQVKVKIKVKKRSQ